MGHNSVVSGHLKSTGISWVDGLSTGPRIWGVTYFLKLLICDSCEGPYLCIQLFL